MKNCGIGGKLRYRDAAELARWDKHDTTDLEDLPSWASLVILFGGLAVGITSIGLVVASWVL